MLSGGRFCSNFTAATAAKPLHQNSGVNAVNHRRLFIAFARAQQAVPAFPCPAGRRAAGRPGANAWQRAAYFGICLSDISRAPDKFESRAARTPIDFVLAFVAAPFRWGELFFEIMIFALRHRRFSLQSLAVPVPR